MARCCSAKVHLKGFFLSLHLFSPSSDSTRPKDLGSPYRINGKITNQKRIPLAFGGGYILPDN